MTMTLKIENTPGPYTAVVKRMVIDDDGEYSDNDFPAVELAPGESTIVTTWAGREIVISEKK